MPRVLYSGLWKGDKLVSIQTKSCESSQLSTTLETRRKRRVNKKPVEIVEDHIWRGLFLMDANQWITYFLMVSLNS